MTQPRPRIGLKIRRAMERKRLDQADVAESLGVSRSAVNAWINDRAWPANSIGALEDLLDISVYDEHDNETDEQKADRLESEASALLEAARRLRAVRKSNDEREVIRRESRRAI